MKVLAIDASSPVLSVGLVATGILVSHACREGGRNSETLLPGVRDCLDSAGTALKDVDLIACASGPGSFTGLRIGMASAKGLSFGSGIPWVSVPTLDFLAWPYSARAGVVAPVLDARKKRVYSALYKDGFRLGDYLDVDIPSLLAMLDRWDEALIVGPDADLLEEYALERPGFRLEEYEPAGHLAGMAALAAEKFAKEGPARDNEGPIYLREPEIGGSGRA